MKKKKIEINVNHFKNINNDAKITLALSVLENNNTFPFEREKLKFFARPKNSFCKYPTLISRQVYERDFHSHAKSKYYYDLEMLDSKKFRVYLLASKFTIITKLIKFKVNEYSFYTFKKFLRTTDYENY